MKNTLKNQAVVYALALVLWIVADKEVFGRSLAFLWLPFIPVISTAMTLTFDWVNDQINFISDENKTVALAVAAGCFAIATAILIK